MFSISFPLGGSANEASRYARVMMAALLPPGKIWRLLDGTTISNLFAGCGDELDRLDERVAALVDEADPSTASELLPEHERELGLDSTGTTAERQARVLGRRVARQRYRPIDIKTALAGLLGQTAANVVVMERTRAFAISVNDDREIFRFFVYRDPTLPGAYFVASAQALLDKIKPSHTAGYVIETLNLLCDDARSLCDRDLLGV